MASQNAKPQTNKPEVDREAVITAAIKSKDVEVVTENNTVKVSLEGQDKPVEEMYRRLKAVTLKGALALSGQDEAELLGHVNYSFDLGARASVRQSVLNRYEDPEKALGRAIKGLMALGLDEASARTQAQAIRAKQAKA